MEWIVIGILAVLLVAAIVKIGQLSNQPSYVEVQESEPDAITAMKVDWFNTTYKLVWVQEEDGTEAYEIRDRKTHQILAYVTEDGIAHPVKQQQEKK